MGSMSTQTEEIRRTMKLTCCTMRAFIALVLVIGVVSGKEEEDPSQSSASDSPAVADSPAVPNSPAPVESMVAPPGPNGFFPAEPFCPLPPETAAPALPFDCAAQAQFPDDCPKPRSPSPYDYASLNHCYKYNHHYWSSDNEYQLKRAAYQSALQRDPAAAAAIAAESAAIPAPPGSAAPNGAATCPARDQQRSAVSSRPGYCPTWSYVIWRWSYQKPPYGLCFVLTRIRIVLCATWYCDYFKPWYYSYCRQLYRRIRFLAFCTRDWRFVWLSEVFPSGCSCVKHYCLWGPANPTDPLEPGGPISPAGPPPLA